MSCFILRLFYIRVAFLQHNLALNTVFNPVFHFMLIVSTLLSVYCQFQLENCDWTIMRVNRTPLRFSNYPDMVIRK